MESNSVLSKEVTEVVVNKKDGDTKFVESYANAVGMDDNNKRIMMIFKTQGEAAGLKALMTHDDGTEMTYAESRARYG